MKLSTFYFQAEKVIYRLEAEIVKCTLQAQIVNCTLQAQIVNYRLQAQIVNYTLQALKVYQAGIVYWTIIHVLGQTILTEANYRLT